MGKDTYFMKFLPISRRSQKLLIIEILAQWSGIAGGGGEECGSPSISIAFRKWDKVWLHHYLQGTFHYSVYSHKCKEWRAFKNEICGSRIRAIGEVFLIQIHVEDIDPDLACKQIQTVNRYLERRLSWWSKKWEYCTLYEIFFYTCCVFFYSLDTVCDNICYWIF